MGELSRLAATGDKMIVATAHRLVNVEDTADLAAAVDWWTGLTEAGGEGMVMKPKDFIVWGAKGLVQPAVKCRGAASSMAPNTMRQRIWNACAAAASGKSGHLPFASLRWATRHSAGREPLRRVHEAVFAILALESEPLDPRLWPAAQVRLPIA